MADFGGRGNGGLRDILRFGDCGLDRCAGSGQGWGMLRGLLFVCGLLCAGVASADGFAPGVCMSAPYEGQGADARLVEVVRDVERAIAGFSEFRAAWARGAPDICLSDDLFEERGYFDPSQNRIVLDASLSRGLMGAVLVHELRHVEQFQLGICPGIRLDMAEYARATFALEADASVSSVVVAWQARRAGEPAYWENLRDWDMSGDIADRFEEVMQRTGDVTLAAAAAFDQWYASDLRRERYYVASCSAFLDEQDRTHALSGYDLLPSDYLDGLCRLPDGRAYDCAEGDLAPVR